MGLSIILICLSISIILIILFLLNIKLFKRVNQKYLDTCKLFQNSSIPFTYFVNKDIVLFHEKNFIFNYARKIKFNDFMDKIISLNQAEIKFWFKNILQVINDKKYFIVEIKIDKGSQLYELKLLNYNKSQAKIYFALNLVKTVGYGANTKYKRPLLNLVTNKFFYSSIFNFINHVKEEVNYKNNHDHFIMSFQVIDNLLMNKYYIYNFNNSITKIIKIILEKQKMGSFVSCIDLDNQYILYAHGKYSDVEVNHMINKIYDKITLMLSKYCIVLDFSIHFGLIKFNTDDLKNTNIQNIIKLSKAALKKAQTEKLLYKMANIHNYLDDGFNSEEEIIHHYQEHPPKLIANYSQISNILTKEKEAILCEINIDAANWKNKPFNINISDLLFKINKLHLLPELINKTMKAIWKNKPLIIKLKFELIFHNFSEVVSELKKIECSHLVVSLTNYSYYDYKDIKWCFENLHKENIECGLSNFKLFNNAFTLISKTGVKYIFFASTLFPEIINNNNRRIMLQTLIQQANGTNKHFIIHGVEEASQAIIITSIGIRYSYGENFDNLVYDKKQYHLIYDYYIYGKDFKLNIEDTMSEKSNAPTTV